MLQPKGMKYRKHHRGRRRGLAAKGTRINFGQYALQAESPCWMTGRQIEAARVAIMRYIKRGGKLWIRVFPDKPVTMTPAETRMGKGKGSPEYYVAVIKPGRILFELEGVSEEVAREAMRLASSKLPMKTRFMKRMATGKVSG
jgi:large subunit ribosomal protein L16